jgi:hypothetical protein
VLLLTDGTVLAHSEPNCLNFTSTDYNSWYKFTPDSSGSYVHGTWTQVASPTGYALLYFGSVVLPDGHVVVERGEYACSSGTCNAAWTNQGAIYDPVKNGWTSVAPPTGWKTTGDLQSVILPNGTCMQANCCTKDEALFNPTTLTWTPTGTGKFSLRLSFSVALWRCGEVVVTRFQIQPASCFAILQYKSIASASCCFSMYSPSVCAT